MAMVWKSSAMANRKHRPPEIANSSEYMIRGPKRSTSMPTTIRAGIVSATLRMRSVLTSWSVRSRASRMEAISGAWLNHT